MTEPRGNILTRIRRGIRYYVKGLYTYFVEEDVLFLSSGLAFNALLCLLPFLLLLTGALGVILNSPHFPSQRIDDALNAVFPPQPYAQQIKNAIKDAIHDIVKYRSTFSFSGAIVLIWTATSLFNSIRTVLNRIYRIRTLKLVVVRILENIVLVIILAILFFVANVFTWILQFANSLINEILSIPGRHLDPWLKFISPLTTYLPALAMFYIMNRFIPDKGVPGKAAFIAAVTTTSLWWIAGKGFAWYLSAFHSYSKVYGTYAFLLVFLVWIYYSSLVFIVGVIVGQLYRHAGPPET